MHDTIRQNDVDGCSKTLDDLDLEDGTFELGQVHEPLAHTLLRQLNEQHDHVWDTLSSDGGGGHKRDVSTKVLVLIVQNRVETLFGESQLSGLETVLELPLRVLALLLVGLSESPIGGGSPAVAPVDLVERHDERRLPVSQQPDRLERLRLQTVL